MILWFKNIFQKFPMLKNGIGNGGAWGAGQGGGGFLLHIYLCQRRNSPAEVVAWLNSKESEEFLIILRKMWSLYCQVWDSSCLPSVKNMEPSIYRITVAGEKPASKAGRASSCKVPSGSLFGNKWRSLRFCQDQFCVTIRIWYSHTKIIMTFYGHVASWCASFLWTNICTD